MSICNIVYNRLEHHEDNFESRELETLKFKIFKPKMKNNKFVNLYKGSKGAMHALDNNYVSRPNFVLILSDYTFLSAEGTIPFLQRQKNWRNFGKL